MRGLRPTESVNHARLLLEATAADPSLASAFLALDQNPLEPTPSGRWLAAMSVMAAVVERAAVVGPPFTAAVER